MNLIDEYIQDDIFRVSESKDLPWMKPIVQIIIDEVNPFLEQDNPKMIEDPNILTHPTGRLFCIPGCEMSIEFPEETLPPQSAHSSADFPNTSSILRKIVTAYTSPTVSFKQEMDNTYSCTATSALFDLNQADAQKTAGHMKYLTYHLLSFNTQFKMIEPIIGSAFLYNDKDKAIISDFWNFVPPQSVPFFTNIGEKVTPSQSCSFQVDPKVITNHTYLIVIYSHPTVVKNGMATIKYYTQSNTKNEQDATKKIDSCFPRIRKAFSTFAWTYIDFNALRVSPKSITLPNAYLIDAPVCENDIHSLLEDAEDKKLKQIPITLTIIAGGTSSFVARPIYQCRAQPLLSPINQLVVKINSLNLTLLTQQKGRNIMIMISLKETPNGPRIPCIHSKLAPELADAEFSRCNYHNRSPQFDDIFLIDLPFPIARTAHLEFEIFHVHAKPAEQTLTLIGKTTLNLCQNKYGLFIANDSYQLPIVFTGSKPNTADKSNRLTITTLLRSNLLTNEPNFFDFQKQNIVNGNIMPSLKGIPSNHMVSNLMIIIDNVLNHFERHTRISFNPLYVIRDTGTTLLEPIKFEKFLMLFVRYFAFRHTRPTGKNVVKEAQISLADTGKKPVVIHHRPNSDFIALDKNVVEQVHSSSSLINLPKIDATPNCLSNDPSHLIIFDDTDSLSSSQLKSEEEHTNHSMNIVDSLIEISPLPDQHIIKSKSHDGSFDVKPLHLKIFICYTKTLKKYGFTRLHNLIDFIFALIIKAIAVSNHRDLGTEFNVFINKWIETFARTEIENYKKFTKSFALFINLLFDIGLPSAASYATCVFLNTFLKSYDHQEVLMSFVEYVFRPTFFLYSMKYIDDFRMTVFKLINFALSGHKNQEIQSLYGVLLRLFSCYDDEMSTEIASILISIVQQVNPNQLSITDEAITRLAFFRFVLVYCNPDCLNKSNADGCSENLFKVAHHILEQANIKEMNQVRRRQASLVKVQEQPIERMKSMKMNVRARGDTICVRKTPPKRETRITSIAPSVNELIHDACCAILVFAEHFLAVADYSIACGLVGIVYHFMAIQLPHTFYPPVFKLLSSVILKFSPDILRISVPCFARVFERIFNLANDFGADLNTGEPILALFKADLKANGNNNRATALIVRTLSRHCPIGKLSAFMEQFKDEQNEAIKQISFIYQKLKEIDERTKDKTLSVEKHVELLFTKFNLLKASPDAQFEVLNDILQIHVNNNKDEERINTLLLQAALVIEYLQITRAVPRFFENDHPALEFSYNCPFASMAVCPTNVMKDLPKIPSFCDSLFFNELGFISILHKIIKVAMKTSVIEAACSIMDLFWPILEKRRFYGQIESMFKDYTELFQLAETLPAFDSDMMEDRFFKASFYGSIFKEEDKKTFIYRAKRLVHLYEFSKNIVSDYQKIYGEANVELIADSADVEPEKLDKAKGFIQVTHVEPFYSKTNKKMELSSLGKTHLLKSFFFDVPFVKGEKKKAQGSVENQWIKHNVLTTQIPLPNIVCRAEVIEYAEIDYEPIRVAYRQLKDRIELLRRAIQVRDMRQVQQLLHGSLLAQVNEGPVKIAEVFLTPPDGDKRRKDKIRKAFSDFYETNAEGVKLHAEWVTQNKDFIPLQVQLENELESLKDKMKTWCV